MKQWFLLLPLLLTTWCAHAAPPPPANEVFQLSVKTLDPNTFSINWHIKPGFFLYRDRIHLDNSPSSNVQLGTLLFPTPTSKTDKQGKPFLIYRGDVILPVAVLAKQPGESLIAVRYQGCSDGGFCYPPETREIKTTVNNSLALSAVSIEPAALPPLAATNNEPTLSESLQVENVFATHHWSMVMLSFFGFGLLLAFTPCVLPMVPVLSGIIVGHGADLTPRKAFLLSLSYVLSMAATYAVVGAVVALLGNNLQIAMQSPLAIGLFSVLFILLSLSMFGFYELKLPLSWQAKLAKLSRSQANGHYLGAAIMGCLSTLILSPCVTAPLLGALSYIAQSGDITFGVLALFCLGLGMGAPLLLIGLSAGKWLPKAGAWMNAVKAFFGVMLLAVAIYLLQRIVPGPLAMGLWSTLLVLTGIFMGALTPSSNHASKLSQGVGILLLVYGLLILIGASMGESNPLQPLARLQITANVTTPIQTATSLAEVKKIIKNARGRPVMLDFYADWCASCKIMEATTLQDPAVRQALKPFVVVKVDLTANQNQEKALLKHFNVVAPPTYVFINKNGQELESQRLVGEISVATFLRTIRLLKNNPV